MSTLRINNIEAQSVPASPSIDEKIKLTNSSGDVLVHVDGKTSGITTIGINTTAGNIKFDQNSNIVVTGIITATKFVGTIEPTNLTVSGDLTIPDKIIHSGDTNTTIRFPAADTITAETGGSERVRINSQGKVLVNTTTASTAGNSQYSRLEVSGNSSSATGPGHLSLKRGTASASLSNGDTLSRLIFSSLDGGDFAYIQASVDGSPSGSDFPGRMMFHTCADGANTATERLRITSGGKLLLGHTVATEVGVGGGGPYTMPLQVIGNSYDTSGIVVARYAADNAGPTMHFVKSRNATKGSQTVVQDGDTLGMLRWFGSDGTDTTNESARISGHADGAPASDRVSGMLRFHTTDTQNYSQERVRINKKGAIGLGGANYGSSGQVLTSQGSGSPVQWASIYNERYTVNNITGTSQINVTNLGTDPHEICINFHLLKGVGDPCAILLRLGTSGGLYSSNVYNQTWTYFNNNSSNGETNSRNHDQNAFWIYNNNFTSPLNIYSGNITLRRTITGTYLLAGSAMSDRNESNNQYSNFTNGRVDISGACTQLRIYVDNGTNFAQGSVTVRTID